MWGDNFHQHVAERGERTISEELSDIEISVKNLNDRLNHLGYLLSQAQDDNKLMRNSDFTGILFTEVGETTAAFEQISTRVISTLSTREARSIPSHILR